MLLKLCITIALLNVFNNFETVDCSNEVIPNEEINIVVLKDDDKDKTAMETDMVGRAKRTDDTRSDTLPETNSNPEILNRRVLPKTIDVETNTKEVKPKPNQEETRQPQRVVIEIQIKTSNENREETEISRKLILKSPDQKPKPHIEKYKSESESEESISSQDAKLTNIRNFCCQRYKTSQPEAYFNIWRPFSQLPTMCFFYSECNKHFNQFNPRFMPQLLFRRLQF